jgi:excinuclease ABC subunit A
MVQDRKGEYQALFEDLTRQGFAAPARVDGEVLDLSETSRLDKYKKHSIEVVVDRLIIGNGRQTRAGWRTPWRPRSGPATAL